MKRILIIAVAALMCSCAGQNQMLISKAVNTTGTASFGDLRFNRSDYEILNTVTAEATISYTTNRQGTNIHIMGIDDVFDIHYVYNKKTGWSCNYSGVLKMGFLSNDYTGQTTSLYSPEDVARRLAMYRCINEVKFQGGDGLIEPTVSTNVEQVSNNAVIFKSTVTAKIIRIKPDSEL